MAQVVVNPTTIRSRPRPPTQFIYLYQFFQYLCEGQCDPYVDIDDT